MEIGWPNPPLISVGAMSGTGMVGRASGGSGGASESSSPGSKLVRKETKAGRERSGSFSRELSARRAERNRQGVNRRPFSMEVEHAHDTADTSAGAAASASADSAVPGPRNMAQMFAYRQGDQVEHNTQTSTDNRRAEVHQNVMNQYDQRQVHVSNQVDQRQVHVHNSADHQVVVQAAREVLMAHERVANVEAEALQAVLEARGQALAGVQEARSQAEVLAVRFAAEIQDSQRRERELVRRIEALQEEVNRRDRDTPVQSPKPPGIPAGPGLSNQNPLDIPNGAGTDVLAQILERVSTLEDEHASLRDLVQNMWYEQQSWNTWPEAASPVKSVSGQPKVHRIDTESDPEEVQRDAAPSVSSGRAEEDIEMQRIKQKDLHYLKFPALPDNAGAFRSWRNSVIPMIASYDRSPEGSVHEWVMRAFRARAEDELQSLQDSSGEYPRFDRVLASEARTLEVSIWYEVPKLHRRM